MKHRLAILCSTFLLSLPFPESSMAQGLAEQGVVGTVGAGALYGATKSLNKPRVDPAVDAMLRQQGYTNVSAASSSDSQYMAIDPNRGPVLITLDPATNQILSAVPR